MAIDFSRIIGTMDQLSVGYHNLFHDLPNNSLFPPHNIVKGGSDSFFLELALAGYERSRINIQFSDGRLTITGAPAQDEDEDDESMYQYRGIASRGFKKEFKISDNFEVKSASMKDGILTVKFVKVVPEEIEIKDIPIY